MPKTQKAKSMIKKQEEKIRRKRKTLRNTSTKGFFSGCARCQRKFVEGDDILGGLYDGVICSNHRSCISCWFEKKAKGKRAFESKKTRNIPLVDNPFSKRRPVCPGCFNHLPPFQIKETPYLGTVDSKGFVVLS